MKVIGYTRVSTREQADEGYSLDTQRAAIETECTRRGWELIEVIEDAGYSGRTTDRPEYQRALLMLARRNGPKAVVVFRLDRLSRSVARLADLFDLSAKQRWGIVAMDRDIDTTSATGRVVANVMASVAQYESEIIGERVAVGMRNAYAKARAAGEQPTFGFQPQVSGDTVQAILDAYAEGESYNAIARWLDAEGVPTPGAGARWYGSTVAAICKREAVAS